jgi:lysozyme family protein
MRQNFHHCLRLVLRHEGGFVHHPKDPGGATNKGVTLSTFRRFVDRNGTVADLKAITDEQLATVYRRHFWDVVGGDALPAGLDLAMFDFAVNSGPGRALQHLRRATGSTSKADALTLEDAEAVAAGYPADLIADVCASRLAFLKRLKTWPTFGRGWERRVSETHEEAHRMAAEAARARQAMLMAATQSGRVLEPMPIDADEADIEHELRQLGSRTIDNADDIESGSLWSRVWSVVSGGGALSALPWFGELPVPVALALIGVACVAAILFYLEWRKAKAARAIRRARIDDARSGVNIARMDRLRQIAGINEARLAP